VKKRTIIVTGATSHIGKEIARHFLENGDNVVINSSNAEKLNQVFCELGRSESLAMVAGNVSDRVTGIKLLAMAVGKFGSADVLVNNAGICEAMPFLNTDEAYFDCFLDANLKGVFFTTQGVIPQMLKQGNGVVINIIAPFVSQAIGDAATTAPFDTKGAIHSLHIQLAAEFGKHNIRFNTIALGTTGMLMQGDMVDWSTLSHSLNSGGEAEDVVQIVYAIAKSNFITGSIINVEGRIAGGHSLN